MDKHYRIRKDDVDEPIVNEEDDDLINDYQDKEDRLDPFTVIG